MNASQTQDFRVVLSQLVLIAILGAVFIAVEMIATGVARQSWLLVLAGVVLMLSAARVIWRARKVVRAGLERVVGRGASSA